MFGKRQRLLHETVQRLLRREARTNIKRIFAKTHPADLAGVIGRFEQAQKEVLFSLLDGVKREAEVLVEMPSEVAAEYLAQRPLPTVVRLLQEMESDDAADIIGVFPEELSKGVLAALDKHDEEVGELLRYGEDTAGGIMNPDFIALHEADTAQAAIDKLRENKDVDMAFYLYVVNDHRQLVGVISLRKLVLVSGETILKEIMEPNVVSVKLLDDQEEVARMVARYNLLAIPVVDENNVLVGIVAVDDVIDVLREEATEDILKMAGAGEELVMTGGIRANIRARFPWLLVACIGELIGVFAISPFADQLKTHHYLALFMPVIMAMGGSIGTQSATVIVRGMAMGLVDHRRMATIYWRELRVAISLGLIYGILVGLATLLVEDASLVFALAVTISLILAMALAVTVGTLLPSLLARLHVDPAVSTGPFVTSSVDVIGLIVYFLVATSLLSTLGP